MAHGGISADVVLTETHDCTSPGKLGDVRLSAIRPAYHSPERIGGQGISQADDTWAIAVTLYYLLTGTMPFAGTTAQEIHQRLAMAPAPLAVFDVGDDQLQAILDRFLARGMGERAVQTPALRDALSRWKHGASVAHLPPLEDGVDDSYSDFDDDEDDEEDDVQTVMRDFSDVREHLKRIEADKPRPAAGAPAATDMRKATSLGGFRAPAAAHAGGHAHAVGSTTANLPPPGARPPQPSHPMAGHGGAPRASYPGAPPPTASSPGHPRPSSQGLQGLQTADAPLGSAPGFDISDEDSDEEIRTVLMDTDKADLSAAIAEALAAKAQAKPPSGPPPGWPPGPPAPAAFPSSSDDDESMAPTAAFDASMLPPGMMPDPLGDMPMAGSNTVDRLLNDIPLPPPPAPPEPNEPAGMSGGPAGAGLGMAPAAAPQAPMQPRQEAPQPMMNPMGGGMHGMAGMMSGDLPTVTEEPKSALRTALIVAVVVLVMVVVAVVVLYLERQGTIHLGLPIGEPSAAPATPKSP